MASNKRTKYLAYETGPTGGNSIDVIPLAGGGKPQTLMKAGSPANPQFSPDGRWLSFSTTESGTRQLYIQSFPAGAGRWQVSSGGGGVSRWRRDGREVVYYDDRQLV